MRSIGSAKVKPLIDGDRVRWVELPSFAEKTKLLREARALLVTSQVAETTSLVALEAMASGTPVIAFGDGRTDRSGAEGNRLYGETAWRRWPRRAAR